MNIQSTKAVLLATAALSVSLGSAAPTMAQQKEATLQDVIVTARRLEERLQDVPISISVFNQQQINNVNIVTSSDLAKVTPSLSTNQTYGGDNATFAIRGFNQDINTAPSVGVYFADVVAPRGATNGLPTGDGVGPGAFFDLQNVQVLKGPQGTLFGLNTTGGAILLVPQRPTSKLGGYVEGSVGNYNLRRIQAVLNLPINDHARLRLGVDRQTRDGFQHNTSGVGPRLFGNVDYTAFRASFVADLASNLENYTVASFTRSDTVPAFQSMIRADPSIGLGGLAAAQLAAQGANFYNAEQTQTNPGSKMTTWQIANTTTWTVTDTLRLKNILSYGQFTQDLNTPLFGVALPNPLGGPGLIPYGTVAHRPDTHTSDQNTSTEELRLEGSAFNNRLTWQSGAYLEVSNPLSQAGAQSPILLICGAPPSLVCQDPLSFGQPQPAGEITYTVGETRFQDVGLYAQSTYSFNDHWRATAGFRYTWDRETNTNTQINYTGYSPVAPSLPNPLFTSCTIPGLAAPCVTHLSVQSNAPTWLLDVDYTPVADLMFYAKYARGYRAATLAPNVPAPFSSIRQERLDAYEVGAKTSFHGPVPGYLNAAILFNNFENQQILVGFNPAPGVPVSPTAAPLNAGTSQIYGLEMELAITPFHGVHLDAAYTYLHTEITSMPGLTLPPGSIYEISTTVQHKGDRLAMTPEHKLVVSARYTLPIAKDIGDISLGATYVYTSDQQANYSDRNFPSFADLGVLPATNILNLDMKWASIARYPVDLSVFATNVTDLKYHTSVAGAISVNSGFETAFPGEPRMFGVRLRYKFGG